MTFPAEEIGGTMVAQTNTLAQLQRQHGRGIWKGTVVRGLPGQITPQDFHEPVMDIGADVQEETSRTDAAGLWRAQTPLERTGLTQLGERLVVPFEPIRSTHALPWRSCPPKTDSLSI